MSDVLERLAARAQRMRPDRDEIEARAARRSADELWHSWEEWIDRRRGRVETVVAPATGTCQHYYCERPSTRVLTHSAFRREIRICGVIECQDKVPAQIPLCDECYAMATGALR